MIRQAISCDICATEKRQTNHWFVAYEQGGELRVSGWNSRYRLRQGAKHLCGQTCLHKLVDEFMAKSIASRSKRPLEEPEAGAGRATDTSLTSGAAYADFKSSARLITPPELVNAVPARPVPAVGSRSELEALPTRQLVEDLAVVPEEAQSYASRSWHAEAWERELRVNGNLSGIPARRRSNA